MNPADLHDSATWEQFVKIGILNTAKVRPIISRSWERCRKQGVNAFLTEGIVIQQNVLREKQKKLQRFLEISRPFMETLYQS